jgi:hypothetical protein
MIITATTIILFLPLGFSFSLDEAWLMPRPSSILV